MFYNPDPDYFSKWQARGMLAFEMETSALYYLAARANAAGEDVRAATILTVSDLLTADAGSEETYLPLDELVRATNTMIDVALDAAIASR